MLLILDGLEPLQYPASDTALAGKLRDPGLETLIKELARGHPGLCIITTRLAIPELQGYTGALSEPLTRIAPAPAAELLAALGVDGTHAERLALAEDYEGHALALTLAGRYLAKVHNGDIRCKDLIPRLTEIPVTLGRSRQAGRVMRRYEVMLGERIAAGDTLAKRQLALLHIMGLFDRKLERAERGELLKPPVIPGLTDTLMDLTPAQWAETVEALRGLGLLSPARQPDDGGLDCHPLVREYFGPALEKGNRQAWRLVHGRLYDFYRFEIGRAHV
jgi:hypothetical protein